MLNKMIPAIKVCIIITFMVMTGEYAGIIFLGLILYCLGNLQNWLEEYQEEAE